MPLDSVKEARGNKVPSKGILVISLEIELAWGVHQSGAYFKLSPNGEREREALYSLLSILADYDINITWGIVGHLFLDKCHGEHPFPFTPDWYEDDPATSLKTHPLWYGRDIIEKILSDPQNHEIACHSFSHVPFNSCSWDVAKFEIEQCCQIAKEYGISLKTFIFPYNLPGHLDLLVEHGFKAYRAVDITRETEAINGRIRKFLIAQLLSRIIYSKDVSRHRLRKWLTLLADRMNLVSNYYPIPTYLPQKALDGLYLLPISRQLPFSEGTGMLNALRVRRVNQAIDVAIKRGEMVHLWGHLYNFKRKQDFQNMRQILQYASQKRGEGKLLILPIKSVIEECIRTESKK